MKTILVPTDFSGPASNALDYAVHMARHTEGKLILLHAYHVPLVATEVPVPLPTLEELGREANAELEKIARKLHKLHSYKLEIECISVCGFAVEEIERCAREKQVDMIIMGMKGAGAIEEKLIGSITTSVMDRVKFPVLGIDEKVKFKYPKKIVLAADYHELKNPLTLHPLKDLVHLFHSHVYILNVVPELEKVPTVEEAIAGVKLDRSLDGINHSFHASANENVVEGINDFVNSKEADMVVMIPHQHSLLKKLFTGSNTKHMAFHTSVPVLALHD